jgi:hypothetical protein
MSEVKIEKEEYIEFLTKELQRTTEMWLLNEAEHRTLQSAVMTNSHNKDLLVQETKTKLAKDYLEAKIRNLKLVIQEVKDGKLNP